jgi:hypothetical protein
MDCGGIEQEIANAYYIDRLLGIIQNMKFILVVTEACLSRQA